MKTYRPGDFLDLDEREARYPSSRFVILPVPYEQTVTYRRGTAAGPAAIIEASHHVEWFDEQFNRELCHCGIYTAKGVDVASLSPQQLQDQLYRLAKRFVDDGKFVLALGGEHSITAALVRAAHERFSRLSVLQLDAHADLRDSYGGSRWSHACVMRRIFEMGVPAVGVGIRSLSTEEWEFISQRKVPIVTARRIRTDPGWIGAALADLSSQVYLTVDIDVLDPSCAPGTGTPEPGGLSWYELTELLWELARHKTIVAADIVEVAPTGGDNVTEFTAARLAYKIIAYLQQAGGTKRR